VTLVSLDAWGRPIDRRNVRQVDQQKLAALRATLDPLTLTPLRNAVIHSAWGRGKIDLPPGIARKLRDTPVYVSSDIRQSKFRKDVAKSMRVERVSDTARNQKFKARDERQESQQADKGGQPRIDRPDAEFRKDNKEAKQQARQPEQQQRKETRDQAPVQNKAQGKSDRRPQGERVAKPAKSEANGEGGSGGKGSSGGKGGGKGKGKKP
jgi:hypothetical protein